jgi:predicted esterase
VYKPLVLVTIALMTVGSVGSCSTPSYTLTPNPTPYVRYKPTEYYLYLPPDYSPDRDWPVFVGVHGTGGSGANCLSRWQEYADEERFVLVCPSLADEGGGWYQEAGERLLKKIIRQVEQECRIQKRVFLAGFSAGAEFIQGYAFHYPESVAGVAVLSAGNYYEPSTLRAKEIPFLVVIGDQDNPVGIKSARLFTEVLEQKGFSIALHILPDVGHTVNAEAKEMTIEFFRQVSQ